MLFKFKRAFSVSSVNGYSFQGASRLSNSDIVFDDATLWGAVLFFYVFVAEHFFLRA
jgi:hypothetical protein